MGFQAIQGAPESFAAVLVTLPDFRNERCRCRRGIQSPAQCGEIDLALADLQAFSIQARGIGDVEVCRYRSDGLDKLVEGPLVMIASQLGMRNVQAHTEAVPVAEFAYLPRAHEQVLITLSAEMPRERRHGLGNHLDAAQVDLGK